MKLLSNCSLPILFLLLTFPVQAQYNPPLSANYTTLEARALMRERVIQNVIERNLAKPLDSSTEENYEDAFTAMEVFRYYSASATNAIENAFDRAVESSPNFQRALLELIYTNFPVQFTREVWYLAQKVTNDRVFAMCSEYLIKEASYPEMIKQELLGLMRQKFPDTLNLSPILFVLRQRLTDSLQPLSAEKLLPPLFSKSFLPGKTVLYSLQRKNRDFPGLVIIRRADGSFLKNDSTGYILNIVQLARSITNLPWYLRNGNTPQGIFSMNGYGVSSSNFIGPTTNIQMGMPVEFSRRKFLGQPASRDSDWKVDDYKALLPTSLQTYFPLYGSYYAGLIGRNSIIAHGTTLDPEIYYNTPYYPLTPTMGCLTSMEIWDGKRIESDQQILINALVKAGGAKGYVVVVELDDQQAPVSPLEVLPFLP